MSKDIKFNLYEVITNQIIEILEEHQNLNWSKSWFPASGEIFAKNPITGTVFAGLNQFLLAYKHEKHNYTSNRWVTYNQAKNADFTIKKGESGQLIYYFNFQFYRGKTNVTREIDLLRAKGEPIPEDVTKKPFIKYYKVFNLCQCEDVPQDLFYQENVKTIDYTEEDKNHLAEETLKLTGANIEYKNGNRCFYRPATDTITMCNMEQFQDVDSFYSTVFHELGHWTGHSSRKNRLKGAKFGSKDYAFEELIAELFSAYICAEYGFAKQITQNAAYIKSWLQALKNDNNFIFSAASKSREALSYVKAIVNAKEPQTLI